MSQEQQPTSSSIPSRATMETNSWNGFIVTRILPRQFRDGAFDIRARQNQHPCRRNAMELLPLLPKSAPSPAPSAESPTPSILELNPKWDVSSENDDELFVLIDFYFVSLTQQQEQQQQQEQSFHFRMDRAASELATRTMQRLEISIAKKFRSIFPNENNNNNNNNESGKKVAKKRKGVKPNIQQSPPTSIQSKISIWQQSSSETDQNNLIEESPFQLQSNSTIAQFCRSLVSLGHSSSSSSPIIPILSLPNPSPMNDCNKIQFKIISCPSTILTISTYESFQSKVFVDVPLVIKTSVLYANDACISWFVDDTLTLHDSSSFTPTQEHIGKTISVLIAPFRVRDYDILIGDGGSVVVECTAEAYQYQNTVEAIPELPIVHSLRSDWIQNPRRIASSSPASSVIENGVKSKSLRVLSYNILADVYIPNEEILIDGISYNSWFRHCIHERDLVRTRRLPLILHELLSYAPDVLCLQEVDAAVYETLLEPVLSRCSYQGYYSSKMGNGKPKNEGCAMFWSTKRFEEKPLSMEAFRIGDVFTDSSFEANEDKEWSSSIMKLQTWMKQHSPQPDLYKTLTQTLGQIVQIACLSLKQSHSEQCRQPNNIVLANTHLFFHPLADHFRALQTFGICRAVDHVRRRQCQNESPPIVICGDFNASPASGAARLLSQRRLEAGDYQTWKHLNDFKWDNDSDEQGQEGGNNSNKDIPMTTTTTKAAPDTAVATTTLTTATTTIPPALVLPSSFPILQSAYPRPPEFTNYVGTFVETLDYILASKPASEGGGGGGFGFRPVASAPTPTRKDVEPWISMPNQVMPSDHVSLVCELGFDEGGEK